MRNHEGGNARSPLVRAALRRKMASVLRSSSSSRLRPGVNRFFALLRQCGRWTEGYGEATDSAYMEGSLDLEVPRCSWELPPEIAECLAERRDLWLFAYGSLMWDPGFAYAEAQPAVLRGYHRSFCVYSHRHRGTPDRPGVVLGLDRGGACKGIAYRIP